jgi:hypothetical protein
MTRTPDCTLSDRLVELIADEGFDALPELMRIMINAAMQAETPTASAGRAVRAHRGASGRRQRLQAQNDDHPDREGDVCGAAGA